ncbi:MAG: hypothetical protein KBT27_11100, partial [Prevotellaceae bacterium]|nr:hypothetical protein [Candidatus Faecinaster equi]
MKKTLLFCLSLLAFSFHSFAEKGYVYERINTLEELVSGKYVIALEGGTSTPECYAIGDEGAEKTASLTDIVTNLTSPYLTNVSSNMVADVTFNDDNTYSILYDGKGFSKKTSSALTLSTQYNDLITISLLSTSHFKLAFSSPASTYLCAQSISQIGRIGSSSSYWKDQHSASKAISDVGAYVKPGAFSFFIQHEVVPTIILNDNGTETQHNLLIVLPDNRHNVGGHVERIFCWEDSRGNRYTPGTLYYAKVSYSGEEQITLTAIYREYEEYWLPISNHVDIDNGDTIVLAVEDGGNGGKCYALTKPTSTTTSNCSLTEK